MEGHIITDQDYPVEGIWILKNIFSVLVGLVILLVILFLVGIMFDAFAFLFGVYIFFTLLFVLPFQLIPLFITARRRQNFHYTLEDKFITFRQGMLSKQQRNVPYGVIQGLFIKQDVFDRLFGLASLTIEDASNRGRSMANVDGKIYVGGKSKRAIEIIGFTGNKVHIPGMKKKNAEKLREIVLQKMKENPLEDSQSGL